jgi:hypothetical protein
MTFTSRSYLFNEYSVLSFNIKPEKRKDHAVAMAKFARLCLNSLPATLSALETILGPGTYELRHMRFGLHSGSVTAVSCFSFDGFRICIHKTKLANVQAVHTLSNFYVSAFVSIVLRIH